MEFNDYEANKEFIFNFLQKKNLNISNQDLVSVTNTFSEWEKKVVLSLPDRWGDYRNIIGLDWDEILEMYIVSTFGLAPAYLAEQEPHTFTYRLCINRYFATFERSDFNDIESLFTHLLNNYQSYQCRLKQLLININDNDDFLKQYDITNISTHKGLLQIKESIKEDIAKRISQIKRDYELGIKACKEAYVIYHNKIAPNII